MDIFESKVTVSGLLFLFTIGSGFWLSRSGKPLNTIIFTIHKLIALGMVVITSIQVYNLFKTVEIQVLLVMLIIIAGLCILALFATGALMSLEKLNYNVLLTIHRVAPILTVLAMSVIIYLVTGKNYEI